MVIKLPLIATLKEHVQILNPLTGKSFRKIRAGRIETGLARSNHAPRFGDFWLFLTMSKNKKSLETPNYAAFLELWAKLARRECDPAGTRTQDPNIKSVVLYQLSYRIIIYFLYHFFKECKNKLNTF